MSSSKEKQGSGGAQKRKASDGPGISDSMSAKKPKIEVKTRFQELELGSAARGVSDIWRCVWKSKKEGDYFCTLCLKEKDQEVRWNGEDGSNIKKHLNNSHPGWDDAAIAKKEGLAALGVISAPRLTLSHQDKFNMRCLSGLHARCGPCMPCATRGSRR